MEDKLNNSEKRNASKETSLEKVGKKADSIRICLVIISLIIIAVSITILVINYIKK